MTSLERAKRFLQNKARTLALSAVPLAALAVSSVPAKATTMLLFESGSCSTSHTGAYSSGPTGTCTVGFLPNQPDFANGLFLTATGGVSVVGSGGSYGVTLDWANGTTNGGAFFGNMPLSWDFTLASSPSGSASYILDFFFNSKAIDVQETGSVSTSSTPTTVSGIGSVAFSGMVSNWEVELQVTETTHNSTLTVVVPNGSIDVNPAPEPASLLLFAPGIGYLLLLRRRRKRT